MDSRKAGPAPAPNSPSVHGLGPPPSCGKDHSPRSREAVSPELRPPSYSHSTAPTLLFASLGLSFCQLQKQQILLSGYANGTATSYLPQCRDAGDYSPVQCDVRREQCWCVDAEGMEVYGTRQLGKPRRCKSHRAVVPPGAGCAASTR